MPPGPQKENGFTPIANEIMEALARFKMPGECRRIVDLILRETWGYQVKWVKIPTSGIAELTCMNPRSAKRSLAALIEHMIILKPGAIMPQIIRSGGNNAPDNSQVLGFNKHYEQWIPFKKKTVKNIGCNNAPDIGCNNAPENEPASLYKRKKESITPDLAKPPTEKRPRSDFKFKVKVPMPTDIYLTDRMTSYVVKQGCENPDVPLSLFEDFTNHHRKTGQKWQDWTMAFYTWVRNDKSRFNPKRYVRRIYDE